MKQNNPEGILGLLHGFNSADLKNAFKVSWSIVHPDLHTEIATPEQLDILTRAFARVSSANDVLKARLELSSQKAPAPVPTPTPAPARSQSPRAERPGAERAGARPRGGDDRSHSAESSEDFEGRWNQYMVYFISGLPEKITAELNRGSRVADLVAKYLNEVDTFLKSSLPYDGGARRTYLDSCRDEIIETVEREYKEWDTRSAKSEEERMIKNLLSRRTEGQKSWLLSRQEPLAVLVEGEQWCMQQYFFEMWRLASSQNKQRYNALVEAEVKEVARVTWLDCVDAWSDSLRNDVFERLKAGQKMKDIRVKFFGFLLQRLNDILSDAGGVETAFSMHKQHFEQKFDAIWDEYYASLPLYKKPFAWLKK